MRAFRRWALPGASVCLAVAALGGAYGSVVPLASAGAARVAFLDTFAPTRAADGVVWRWMSDSTRVVLRDRGRRWLAFRAVSHRIPRRLTLSSRSGKSAGLTRRRPLRLRVVPRQRTYLVGPVAVKGVEVLHLTARPPAQSRGFGRRRVSIRLSRPVLVARPAAAIPTAGFFPTQFDDDGVPFNWLRRSGKLELVNAGARLRRAWVSFWANPSRRTRVLRLTGRSHTDRATVLRDAPRRVTVGPFLLHRGRASLAVAAKPPPDLDPGSGRRVSIAISGIRVTRTPRVRRVPREARP